MALTLYKTSKHSRLYKGIAKGGLRSGFSKTSIAPMHYESVIGSGNYDTAIDTTCVRVIQSDLDGYEMTSAGWHFRLQVADPSKSVEQPNTQRPPGTVGFGGRQGENWFYFRLINAGHMHWKTRKINDIAGEPDYSNEPIVDHRARNLGSHLKVQDEIISSNTLIQWGNIWNTPNEGEISVKWGIKQGKLKEEVVINKAAREWIAENKPASTPDDETWFGFRFEIDTTDIAKVSRDGVEQNMNGHDFDDDDCEGICLHNSFDELLAFMPLDFVYVTGKGGRRPLRKRFYQEDDNNYLMVAAKMKDIEALLPGDIYFDPSMTQEQVTSGADDCFQSGFQTGASIVEYNTNISYMNIVVSRYDYYYAPYFTNQEYRIGIRFTPDVPANAKFSGGNAYATLRMYQDAGVASAGYPVIDTFADVASSNQPAFAVDRADSPEPGTNWTDSFTKSILTTTFIPTAGNQMDDIDVSTQMEEVCSLLGWAPGNGMRFRCKINDAKLPNYGVSYGVVTRVMESYDDVAASAGVLDAYYTLGGGAGKNATSQNIQQRAEQDDAEAFGNA